MTLATLPDNYAQIGADLARSELHSRDDPARRIESIALSHSYSPSGMLIRRPVILSAAHKDTLRHWPRFLDRPDRRFRAATIRAARPRRRAQTKQMVAASAWLGLLGAPHGMGSFGAGSAFADLL